MSTPSPVVTMPEVPARLRFALYWIVWLLGTISAILTGVWAAVAAASPVTAPPLWLVITLAVINLLSAQLNGLAGSNVVDRQSLMVGVPMDSTVDVDVNPPSDQRGVTTTELCLIVIAAIAVILFVAWLTGR